MKLSDHLNEAFYWAATPQGHDFWDSIHTMLVEIEEKQKKDSPTDDADVVNFIDSTDTPDVSGWTNRMLEKRMDRAFFRFSMFENYRVTDDPDSEI